VAAALLAAAGLTGPPTALEGRYGLVHSLLGDGSRLDVIGAGLGSEWHLPEVDFKRYPANGFTHAAIEAVRVMRNAGLVAEDVEAVTLAVAAPSVRTIGQPIERKRRPASTFEAQRSGPFVIAASLLGTSQRGVGVEDFDPERLTDPRYLRLMDRVEVVADPAFDAVFPDTFPATVTVMTRDGRRIEETAGTDPASRGMSEHEVVEKFLANAALTMDVSRAERIAAAVRIGGGARGLLDLVAG
jgi:2-methylcitrate dehydratase PrpD